MKIAFYTSPVLGHGGGFEHYLMRTARELKERYPYAQIDIISNGEQFSRTLGFFLSFFYFNKIGKKVIGKETAASIKEKIGPDVNYIKTSSLKDLKHILKGYDVIYSKNELLETFIFKYLLKYKNTPPVVFGVHTPLSYPKPRSIQDLIRNFLYSRGAYKTFAGGAAAFHVVSAADEAMLRRLLPNKKTVKILYPFDLDEYANIADTRKIKFSFDRSLVNILWVGRVTKLKGADDLAQIIELVNQRVSAAKISWNIAGDGPGVKKLQTLNKKWGNVNLLGHTGKDDLPSIYKGNDLFVGTSYVETFGYTIVEALSFDLPVIMRSNNGGAQELIKNGKNGYVVDGVEEFAEKIESYIKSGGSTDQEHKKEVVKKLYKNTIYGELMSLLISAKG